MLGTPNLEVDGAKALAFPKKTRRMKTPEVNLFIIVVSCCFCTKCSISVVVQHLVVTWSFEKTDDCDGGETEMRRV